MTNRRAGHGSGTYTQLPSGSWRSQGYDRTGKRRSVTHPATVRTRRDAIEAHRRFMLALGRGDYAAEDHTLAELLETWADSRRDLAAGTQRGNRSRLDVHILPALGHLKLSQVTTYTLDRFYAGLSPSVALNCHRFVLSPALHQAVKWGWITSAPKPNPRGYRAPKVDPPELDDIHRFIQTVPEPWFRLYLRVVAVAGLRKSEALALRWEDIDPAKGVIFVSASVSDAPTVTPTLKSTKTGAVRRVGVDPQTIAELRAHQARVQARALELNGRVGPFIFGGDRELLGAHPIHPKRMDHYYRKAAARVGWEHKLHDFRHAAATHLLSNGHSPAAAAARLGNDPKLMITVYASVLPSDDTAAALALALPSTT